MKKRILTLLFIFNGIFSNAQSSVGFTKLHEFLLNQFDSTIIYYSYSNWHFYPNYLIVSKVKNQVYFFTYINPYRKPYPADRPIILNRLFSNEEIKFTRTAADTNQYFLPFYLHPSKKDSIWREINTYNIWDTKIDHSFKESTNNSKVQDGDEFEFHLITKEGIKRKYWYEADTEERYSPGNPYRLSGIRTRNALWEVFKIKL